MDERVSIRAHVERFPADLKGAFVLRGADGEPHQVRIEAAAGRASGGRGGTEPIGRRAGRSLEVAPDARHVRAVRGRRRSTSRPGWYRLECDVVDRRRSPVSCTRAAVRDGVAARPCGAGRGGRQRDRRRRRRASRSSTLECARRLACGSRTLRDAGPADAALAVDGPRTLLEVDARRSTDAGQGRVGDLSAAARPRRACRRSSRGADRRSRSPCPSAVSRGRPVSSRPVSAGARRACSRARCAGCGDGPWPFCERCRARARCRSTPPWCERCGAPVAARRACVPRLPTARGRVGSRAVPVRGSGPRGRPPPEVLRVARRGRGARRCDGDAARPAAAPTSSPGCRSRAGASPSAATTRPGRSPWRWAASSTSRSCGCSGGAVPPVRRPGGRRGPARGDARSVRHASRRRGARAACCSSMTSSPPGRRPRPAPRRSRGRRAPRSTSWPRRAPARSCVARSRRCLSSTGPRPGLWLPGDHPR